MALPKLLDQERRITLKPSFLSQALNEKGELEGLTESPCPVSQLPPVIREALAEDRLSQVFWGKSTRWVDALGTHLDPVCGEVMSRLFLQDESSFVNLPPEF